MEKKQILKQLYALKENVFLSDEDKIVVDESIQLISKAKKWEQCIKVVEILVKLLAVGSKFF